MSRQRLYSIVIDEWIAAGKWPDYEDDPEAEDPSDEQLEELRAEVERRASAD